MSGGLQFLGSSIHVACPARTCCLPPEDFVFWALARVSRMVLLRLALPHPYHLTLLAAPPWIPWLLAQEWWWTRRRRRTEETSKKVTEISHPGKHPSSFSSSPFHQWLSSNWAWTAPLRLPSSALPSVSLWGNWALSLPQVVFSVWMGHNSWMLSRGNGCLNWGLLSLMLKITLRL